MRKKNDLMVVFVSRDLKAGGPLASWADGGSHRIVAKSLLSFTAVPFAAPAGADWWFFYSSRAVQFAG